MIQKTKIRIASVFAMLATFVLGLFAFFHTGHTAQAQSLFTPLKSDNPDNCIPKTSVKHTEIPEFVQGRLSPSAATNASHEILTALVRKDQEQQFLMWMDEHNLKWGLSYKDLVDAAIAFRIEQIQKAVNEK